MKNENKVIIPLEEYNNLQKIKETLEAKPHIIFYSYDGYCVSFLYVDTKFKDEVKKVIGSILDDYVCSDVPVEKRKSYVRKLLNKWF